MIKTVKATICVLTTALLLAATATPAHAGTLTIHNKNCTKVVGFKKHKRVTVHVYDLGALKKCTNEKVTINKGQSKTISLKEVYKVGPIRGGDTKNCEYQHEAKGTVGGKRNILGRENASVTCKKDWASVCQCTKD